MGKRKIICGNNSCKHYSGDGMCDTNIVLDGAGKCQSFEKGFAYYFHIVWNSLDNKNFIDAVEIQQNPDLKIGMYYVAECYNLSISVMEWGNCRMFFLEDKGTGEKLDYEKIIQREIDEEKFQKFYKDFKNGILPGQDRERSMDEKETEHGSKEFGWVSPMGEFTESPWGEHEQSAGEICKEKGFMDQYENWCKENDKDLHLIRDFLMYKGYCLIHNPTGDGDYTVTHIKDLTKRQREFLYDYFIGMGDRIKAELYFDK